MGTSFTPPEFQAVDDQFRPPEFQAVHAQFRARVLRYLTSLVGESEAEDLTQAVMLKVSNGLPGFRGDSSLSTWIFRIAKNAAVDKLRCKTIELAVEVDVDGDESDEEDAPHNALTESLEATAIRQETSACIRAFIERLPDNYKSVMALSELEGFKNEEIAAILGLTVGTVKIRLHRGREQLRKDLQEGCSFDRDKGGELGCDPKPAAAVKFPRRR
jgi:RNA polymerase sigma-70 factor (ECF subfamily)